MEEQVLQCDKTLLKATRICLFIPPQVFISKIVFTQPQLPICQHIGNRALKSWSGFVCQTKV